jgi:hypothetical protein
MEKQKNTPIFYFCNGKQIVTFKNQTMDVFACLYSIQWKVQAFET